MNNNRRNDGIYVTYTYVPDILTDTPHRMVCDVCEWVSDSTSRVSALCRQLTDHSATHVTRREVKLPPQRPNLCIVRG